MGSRQRRDINTSALYRHRLDLTVETRRRSQAGACGGIRAAQLVPHESTSAHFNRDQRWFAPLVTKHSPNPCCVYFSQEPTEVEEYCPYFIGEKTEAQ